MEMCFDCKEGYGGNDEGDGVRLVAKAANLKSQRVWLSASCLFNNNDGKLNVNTPHPRKKDLFVLKFISRR